MVRSTRLQSQRLYCRSQTKPTWQAWYSIVPLPPWGTKHKTDHRGLWVSGLANKIEALGPRREAASKKKKKK